MTSSISFRCRGCGEEAGELPADGADIRGYAGGIEWLAAEPGPNPARPLLLETTPVKDGEHRLAVRFPFRAQAARPFWCLFMPPLAHFNGWAGEPGEIPRSSLVRCRMLEVEEADAAAARIRIEVIRALPLGAIGAEIPIHDTPDSLFDVFGGPRTAIGRCGNFTYVSYSLEGDVGAWAVVEERDSRHFLILHGDWSWHADWFRADNRLLSEAELDIVNRIAAPAPARPAG